MPDKPMHAAHNKVINKLFILGLAVLCLTVYFNSLNNPFIFDDEGLIVSNHLIKSSKFLPHIFKKSLYEYSHMTTAIAFDKMYRPIQILTYSIDYRIWKLNPFGFHLTNTLLHLLNSVLVYYLLSIIFASHIVPKIVSLLFLVHPVNTSVVSYISGRADILACFFMLLSMICFFLFIKLRPRIFYVFSLLCAIFALLSRENALLLFLFIILILFFIKSERRYYLYIMPFIFLDLLYLLLRYSILGRNALTLHASLLSLPLRIANFINIIPKYLSVLLLPLDLHLFRSAPFITNLFDMRVFLSLGFVLLCFFLIMRAGNKYLLLFSAFWFLAGIIPVFIYLDGYNILNTAIMSENWVYMPSIGFFVIFTSCLDRLRRLGKVLIVSMIIFYSFLTAINNAYWKSDIILYEHILKYNSMNHPVRQNLIKAYLNHRLFDDAILEINKLIIRYPQNPQVNNLLGSYYFSTGQIEKAVDTFKKALDADKKFFYAFYNLSLCYEKIGDFDTAIEYALGCLRINPYFFSNLVQLGELYAQRDEPMESKKYYLMALSLDPDNQDIKDKVKNGK